MNTGEPVTQFVSPIFESKIVNRSRAQEILDGASEKLMSLHDPERPAELWRNGSKASFTASAWRVCAPGLGIPEDADWLRVGVSDGDQHLIEFNFGDVVGDSSRIMARFRLFEDADGMVAERSVPGVDGVTPASVGGVVELLEQLLCVDIDYSNIFLSTIEGLEEGYHLGDGLDWLVKTMSLSHDFRPITSVNNPYIGTSIGLGLLSDASKPLNPGGQFITAGLLPELGTVGDGMRLYANHVLIGQCIDDVPRNDGRLQSRFIVEGGPGATIDPEIFARLQQTVDPNLVLASFSLDGRFSPQN